MFVAAFLGCSISPASHSPRVTFSYAKVFDSVCSQQTGFEIQSGWVTELNSRLPALQISWDKSGQTLLKTTVKIIGKEFQESELGVALSVCSFPSLSDPLLVNMHYSLKSFTENPLSTDVTISIFFHEILHRYLIGKIPNDSRLLLKYKSEDETVLSHLHLFAIRKAVYLELGEANLLREVIKKDVSLPNPDYKRAWEIVNSLEDYHSFLDELIKH